MTVTGGRPITLQKHKNICADVIIYFFNVEYVDLKKQYRTN